MSNNDLIDLGPTSNAPSATNLPPTTSSATRSRDAQFAFPPSNEDLATHRQRRRQLKPAPDDFDFHKNDQDKSLETTHTLEECGRKIVKLESDVDTLQSVISTLTKETIQLKRERDAARADYEASSAVSGLSGSSIQTIRALLEGHGNRGATRSTGADVLRDAFSLE